MQTTVVFLPSSFIGIFQNRFDNNQSKYLSTLDFIEVYSNRKIWIVEIVISWLNKNEYYSVQDARNPKEPKGKL